MRLTKQDQHELITACLENQTKQTDILKMNSESIHILITEVKKLTLKLEAAEEAAEKYKRAWGKAYAYNRERDKAYEEKINSSSNEHWFEIFFLKNFLGLWMYWSLN